jgi:hypothetical protein
MILRIKANLKYRHGREIVKEIAYWGAFDQARGALYYASYDGCYFEWITYVTAPVGGYYDYEAQYVQMYNNPPLGTKIFEIDSQTKYGPPKCECGSEKTGSNKHSHWCPKFD